MHTLLAAAAVTSSGSDTGMIVAYAISGAATFAAAVVSGYFAYKGQHHAATAATHAKAADHAVNNVPEGSPTLRETAEHTQTLVVSLLRSNATQDERAERVEGKVDDLAEDVRGLNERVTGIEEELDARE